MERCNHEWWEDDDGIMACFYCGIDGPKNQPYNLTTECVECGEKYAGRGGRGLCGVCSDQLGMHEMDLG